MNNAIAVFNNPEFGNVRVIQRQDGLWFVAADVCAALDLDNVSQAVSGLDDDEKGIISVDTPGGSQEMLMISEPGLYSLVLRSRKPEAKTFKRWITHDVIPAIRQHGGYLTPAKIEEALLNPDTLIRLATDLKTEREQRQALEAQAEKNRPKVVFADSIEVSEDAILVGEMAKLIKQSTGYDTGRDRFYTFLKDNGYVHKHGSERHLPTQRSMAAGWMVIKIGSRIGSDGKAKETKTTKITGKGQVYFINLFRKKMEARQFERYTPPPMAALTSSPTANI